MVGERAFHQGRRGRHEAAAAIDLPGSHQVAAFINVALHRQAPVLKLHPSGPGHVIRTARDTGMDELLGGLIAEVRRQQEGHGAHGRATLSPQEKWLCRRASAKAAAKLTGKVAWGNYNARPRQFPTSADGPVSFPPVRWLAR